MRRDDGHVLQSAATESMPKHGEAPALVIGQPQRAVAELGPQRAVLLEQVGKGFGLAFPQPGAQREGEPAQGDDIDHGGRIAERPGFSVRPINRTLRGSAEGKAQGG